LDVITETARGGVAERGGVSWEHRPVLLGLIERAQAGEYDVLLVARLDRLSRDHATLVVLERHGVSVVSVAEENGDGPVAEFIRGQLALVAELERALIRDRVQAGKLQKKKLGRHVHGRVPYGYRSTGGILEPVEELVPIVKRIYRDARDGWTPGRIARALNRDGVPSAQGASGSPRSCGRSSRTPSTSASATASAARIVGRRRFNEAQTAR
jgi:DNA invertase Pin-like site-specific DNA recombinase